MIKRNDIQIIKQIDSLNIDETITVLCDIIDMSIDNKNFRDLESLGIGLIEYLKKRNIISER